MKYLSVNYNLCVKREKLRFLHNFLHIYFRSHKELRCREEELTKAQVQQRQHEENLRQREQELAAREIDLLERELTVMIIQQQNTPTPNKRRGKFKKSRLKLNKKEPGSNISAPSGKRRFYISQKKCNM